MSTMIYFDTLECVKMLKAGGFSETQAETFVKVQQKSFTECLDTTLATKVDISRIELSMQKMEGTMESIKLQINLLKGMIGISLLGTGTLILETFFK